MGKFKAKDHEQEGMDFSPVPAGEYTLALVKAERKESKTTPGNYYLNCQFTITKGKFAKRVIFGIFNLKNNNEQAQNIAEGELSSLMLAVGVSELKDKWDVTSLMNIEFKARLGIQESKGYDPKNVIKKYIPKKKSSKKDGKASMDAPWEKKGKKKKGKGKKKK